MIWKHPSYKSLRRRELAQTIYDVGEAQNSIRLLPKGTYYYIIVIFSLLNYYCYIIGLGLLSHNKRHLAKIPLSGPWRCPNRGQISGKKPLRVNSPLNTTRSQLDKIMTS